MIAAVHSLPGAELVGRGAPGADGPFAPQDHGAHPAAHEPRRPRMFAQVAQAIEQGRSPLVRERREQRRLDVVDAVAPHLSG